MERFGCRLQGWVTSNDCRSQRWSLAERVRPVWLTISHCRARVAEWADALDLKSSVPRDVWVQVPPRAPIKGCAESYARLRCGDRCPLAIGRAVGGESVYLMVCRSSSIRGQGPRPVASSFATMSRPSGRWQATCWASVSSPIRPAPRERAFTGSMWRRSSPTNARYIWDSSSTGHRSG